MGIFNKDTETSPAEEKTANDAVQPVKNDSVIEAEDEPSEKEGGDETPGDASPVEGRAGDDSEAPSDSGSAFIPVLPLRDTVVFSTMIVPLFENREKGLAAIEAALAADRRVYVVAQRDASADDPVPAQLYSMGTVAVILRQVRLPDGQVKLLVQGMGRALAGEYDAEGPVLRVRVSMREEIHPDADDDAASAEIEALMHVAREQSEKILQLRGMPAGEIMGMLNSVSEPGRLADIVAANIRMTVDDAQGFLECLDVAERLRRVCRKLLHEAEIAGIQAKIQAMARESMEKSQKEYFLREQLKAIHQELGDDVDEDEEQAEYRRKLDGAGLPGEARKEADKQLRRLLTMHNDSAEASVIRTYLDLVVELPWKKRSRDRLDIKAARRVLDRDHCGLEKVKDRILEFLSVRKLSPDAKGPVLCFVGPPGVGKTSLGKSIATAMGRRFERISLGGMHDEAEIRGHRRTYIGAMPGRIIQAMKHAGTCNPVIVLDEIDKVGSDHRGDPAGALLEALDPEQNAHFSDHYLNLEYDLSKVLFLCTANQLDTIPPALLDRMEVIELSGYTEQEKLAIASGHLVRRQCMENGLGANGAVFRREALAEIIRGYTREAGVRSLEREIGAVCRKLALRRAEGAEGPFTVEFEDVAQHLGRRRFVDEDREKALPAGVALGLAWTQAGGEVLHVEVSTVKGKGAVLLTGKLGDVMKESAQAAVTWTRAHAEEYGINPDFAQERDIHVHVPAGATPKDGPSAGVTLATALVSSLSGRPVRSDVCMTGEITLRGRVMPVGGIKEKLLGAAARGLKTAFIPSQNLPDLEDIPAELRESINVRPVETLGELIPLVLEPGTCAPASPRRSRRASSANASPSKGGAQA